MSDKKKIKNEFFMIDKMFSAQKKFSNKYFDSDLLNDREKEAKTCEFVAALHGEVSSLLNAVNFKDHLPNKKQIDVDKIKFESVDSLRYILAILNLWGISPEEFIDAFDDKNEYLNLRRSLYKTTWENQPVLIVDVDDVIFPFRELFTDWLVKEKKLEIETDSPEYYHTVGILQSGYSPEGLFEEFISLRRLQKGESIPGIINVLNRLYDEGVWIHLLTARPQENLLCFYDTARWLSTSGLKFHRIDHTPEKFLWVSKTKYYEAEKVLCAVDDSPKHASEYAKHGMFVMAPYMAYNSELNNVKNVIMYNDPEKLYHDINSLLKKEK